MSSNTASILRDFSLILFVLCTFKAVPSYGQDPFQEISRITLENGLTLVLAPSDSGRTVETEMRVLTGWDAETADDLGIAELTQSLLFRDNQLRYSSNYLRRIQDSGGKAVGKTTATYSSLSATVPSIKGIWILNELSNIFMLRKFSPQDFEKAKTEVMLKLGEPNNVLQRFFASIIPNLNETPSFMETEFGLRESKRELDDIRRSVRKITLEQVQQFYETHYQPHNMVMFVAGPIKKEPTANFIRETFEQYSAIPKSRSEQQSISVTPRREAYLRSKVAKGNAKISIGTKFWEINTKEEIVLRVYFEYLADRLTKSLRNEFGETYQAKFEFWNAPSRFGYARVSFETPNNKFNDNLSYIRDLIYRETIEGDFTDRDISLSRENYQNQINLVNSNGNSMLDLAVRLYQFQVKYQTDQTPYQVFRELSNDEFRQTLRGTFHPRKEYLALEEPPLWFRGEAFILFLFAVSLAIVTVKHKFLKKFDNTRIRYLKKLRFSVVTLLLFTLGFIAVLWISAHISTIAHTLLLHSNVVQSTFVLSQYVENSLSIFLLVASSLSFFCFIPRKILVTDQHLYIKSISYASKKVDILEVRDVFICRPQHLFSHRLFNRRVRILHWTPWKKGIFIRLQDGSGYYVSFNDAHRVAQELRDVLRTRPRLHLHDAA